MVNLGFDLLVEADKVMDEVIVSKKKEREPARRYRLLNSQWPATIPPMTDRDVRFAARVLFRLVIGRKFRGKLVVKHQGRSYMHPAKIVGNARRGWHDVVHDWSHQAHGYLYPNETGHGPHQAFIERKMVEEVVKRGWLTGRLNKPKPEKSKPDVRGQRQAAVLKKLAKWQTRLKRAKTAIKKLEKQKAYYEKERPAPKPRQPREKKPPLRQRCLALADKLTLELAENDIRQGQHYVGKPQGMPEDKDPFELTGHYVQGWQEVMERLKAYEKLV